MIFIDNELHITNNENIAVSILCMAYNHERYIERALQSFINQKTKFRFEVIINDDCSTDNTAEIILKYYNKYPDILVPIIQKNNLYQKGIDIMIDVLLPRARGKYFAICEGDDYFIDVYKLQKQFEFLETHPDFSLCIHNSIYVNEKGNFIKNHSVTDNLPRQLSCEEVILGDGGFCSTNSIMAPMWTVKKLPFFFKFYSIDLVWQMYLASLGKVYCFKEYMSAYRVSSIGSWTSKLDQSDINYKVYILKKIINVRKLFNVSTNFKYDSAINDINSKYKMNIFLQLNNSADLKKMLKKRNYRSLSIRDYLKFYIFAYFPFIYKHIKSFMLKRQK